MSDGPSGRDSRHVAGHRTAGRTELRIPGLRAVKDHDGDGFERLCEALPDGIVVSDREGRILYVNGQIETMTGYRRDELLGQSVEILAPERLGDAHERHRAGYLTDPRIRSMGTRLVVTCRRKDGTELPVDIGLSPLETDDGLLVVSAVRYASERSRAERELREAEERYRSIFENSIEGIFQTTLDGRYLVANPALAGMLGYESPEDLMASVTDVRALYVEPHERDEFMHLMQDQGILRQFEYQVGRKDGSAIWVSEKVRALRDPSGEVIGFEGMTMDVTGRKRAEEALEARARQQAAVAELGQRALAGDDPSTLMDEAVALIAGTLEVEYAEVLELLPDGSALLLRAGVGWREGLVGHAAVGVGTDSQAGYTLLSNGPVVVEDLAGETRFAGPPLLRDHGVVSGVSVVITGADRPFGVLGAHTATRRTFDEQAVNFLHSIANVLAEGIQRARAERELQTSLDALRRGDDERRRLLDRLASAHEEERRRIAADIHDDSLQKITAVALRLHLLRQKTGDAEQQRLLDRLNETVNLAIGRLRHLLFELRPPSLDRDGLATALREYLEMTRAEAGLDYRVDNRLRTEPPGETRASAYRIAQEAISNVRKHANASTVDVLVDHREGGLLVRIRDDGVGISDLQPLPEASAGHLGLATMRERAEMTGGWWQIESSPGQGTCVEFWLPVEARQA